MNTIEQPIATHAERIVNSSQDLLVRLQTVNDRLARVIERAAGPGPEEAGKPATPRSSGLLSRTSEEIGEAHDVVSLIFNQIDTIDSLI